MAAVRATVDSSALRGAEAARTVIAAHLRSDAGGRCLTCGEIEPCRQRNTAHMALFGHGRQLPRRTPLALIGSGGDFAGIGGSFRAFGPSA